MANPTSNQASVVGQMNRNKPKAKKNQDVIVRNAIRPPAPEKKNIPTGTKELPKRKRGK